MRKYYAWIKNETIVINMNRLSFYIFIPDHQKNDQPIKETPQ